MKIETWLVAMFLAKYHHFPPQANPQFGAKMRNFVATMAKSICVYGCT